jgi:hypothetical protein
MQSKTLSWSGARDVGGIPIDSFTLARNNVNPEGGLAAALVPE